MKKIWIVYEKGPNEPPYRFVKDSLEEAEKQVANLKNYWKNYIINKVPERKHVIEEYILVGTPLEDN